MYNALKHMAIKPMTAKLSKSKTYQRELDILSCVNTILECDQVFGETNLAGKFLNFNHCLNTETPVTFILKTNHNNGFLSQEDFEYMVYATNKKLINNCWDSLLTVLLKQINTTQYTISNELFNHVLLNSDINGVPEYCRNKDGGFYQDQCSLYSSLPLEVFLVNRERFKKETKPNNWDNINTEENFKYLITNTDKNVFSNNLRKIGNSVMANHLNESYLIYKEKYQLIKDLEGINKQNKCVKI